MDDYSVASLSESKNEWCAELVNILTPAVVSGIRSIFEEAWQLCVENDEEDKYLITFQTFLSRVPKWNNEIVKEERKRIVEESSCVHLEDLVTCVHVIQLKALTCIRVGQEQKKVEIDIPSVDQFVHNVYINVARKVYTNVYLFEKGIAPLQFQKHNRELEIIIKECVMNTIRETMPVEDILRAYMSETQEDEVNVSEEVIERPAPEEVVKANDAESSTSDNNNDNDNDNNNDNDNDNGSKQPNENVTLEIATDLPDRISFNDTDRTVDITGNETEISAPKTVERLEKIALEANERRKAEEAEEDDDDMPLRIGEEVRLELTDINDLNKAIDLRPPPVINIETL
jgi:hypothetical protein